MMIRVELYILLLEVVLTVVGAYRPYCPCYSQPGYQCPPAPQGCELTQDECGCCDVCAGLLGESCGTGLPSCATGLTCVLEECNQELVDVTLTDGTVVQQLSEPPCLFLPYFRRGTCGSGDTAVKRQAIPVQGGSCEVDGVTVPNGEFVHVTPCKPCTCYNGQPICTHVDCPWAWLSQTCAQWETPADRCCPVCTQEISQEVVQQEIVQLPAVSKRQALPTTGASCQVSGVTIQEGEWVYVTPCEHCGCNNGQPICAVMDCFWQPGCTQWAYPADQCCPVCVQEGKPVMEDMPLLSKRTSETCEVDGVTIAEGEWKPTDEYGCTTCGCANGQPLCWSMACGLDINCAEWDRIPGQCCPVCTAYHQQPIHQPILSKRTSPVTATCEVQGVTIAEGEWRPIDEFGCTTCGCSNGQSFCQAIGCAMPANCAQTQQLPGQCCPVCVSYATCEVNGVVIQEGETKPTDEYGCETCTCVNGQPICQAMACAMSANCAQTEQLPGQCCPVCTSYYTCQVDGVTIQEGETATITPCKHCTCSNGQPLCAMASCLWEDSCTQWEHPADQCCPVCVQNAAELPVASKR